MSHNLKQILLYLCAPVIFTALAYGVYKQAGEPIEQYVSSQIQAAIEKGNPSYTFKATDVYLKEDYDTSDAVKESEVNTPSIGEQYGVLMCEELELTAPLYFGDDDEILEKGVGQYVKSKLPGFGGTILTGGHDSTYFAPLEKVEEGMEFDLYTDYGKYTYKVRETAVVKTDDSEACQLDHETEQLVMYTCYPFGEVLRARDERFFVYCDLIKGQEVEVEYNEKQ